MSWGGAIAPVDLGGGRSPGQGGAGAWWVLSWGWAIPALHAASSRPCWHRPASWLSRPECLGGCRSHLRIQSHSGSGHCPGWGRPHLLPSLLLPLGYTLPNWASPKAPTARCLPWLVFWSYMLLGLVLPSPLLLWLPSGSPAEPAGIDRPGRLVQPLLLKHLCVPGTAVAPNFQTKKLRLAGGEGEQGLPGVSGQALPWLPGSVFCLRMWQPRGSPLIRRAGICFSRTCPCSPPSPLP